MLKLFSDLKLIGLIKGSFKYRLDDNKVPRFEEMIIILNKVNLSFFEITQIHLLDHNYQSESNPLV